MGRFAHSEIEASLACGKASAAERMLDAGGELRLGEGAAVEERVIEKGIAGRNPSYDSHPRPADAHHACQRDLLLAAQRLIIDRPCKVLRFRVNLSKADVVSTRDAQS